MEREDVIDSCGDIFDAFEKPDPEDHELTLIKYLDFMTRPGTDFVSNILAQSEEKLEGKTAEDVLNDEVIEPLTHLAFGIGFTLGSLGECADSNISLRIDEVRTAIKEMGLLSYVPRGRKAA